MHIFLYNLTISQTEEVNPQQEAYVGDTMRGIQVVRPYLYGNLLIL